MSSTERSDAISIVDNTPPGQGAHSDCSEIFQEAKQFFRLNLSNLTAFDAGLNSEGGSVVTISRYNGGGFLDGAVDTANIKCLSYARLAAWHEAVHWYCQFADGTIDCGDGAEPDEDTVNEIVQNCLNPVQSIALNVLSTQAEAISKAISFVSLRGRPTFVDLGVNDEAPDQIHSDRSKPNVWRIGVAPGGAQVERDTLRAIEEMLTVALRAAADTLGLSRSANQVVVLLNDRQISPQDTIPVAESRPLIDRLAKMLGYRSVSGSSPEAETSCRPGFIAASCKLLNVDMRLAIRFVDYDGGSALVGISYIRRGGGQAGLLFQMVRKAEVWTILSMSHVVS